jgi:hypothetical protein
VRRQGPGQRARLLTIARNKALTCGYSGALGGTRTPNLLIRRFLYRHPAPFKSVRDLGLVSPGCPGGSGTSEGCSSPWLPAWLPGADPQAGHIPRCHGSYECYAPSPVAAACRWLLLLLSTRHRLSSSKPVRTLQGMARVRSGQAPAWPLSSVRSVRRGSRIKRDFACTCARHVLPVLGAVTVTLDAGGAGTYTQRAIPGSEPSQDFCIFRPHANRDYHAGHGHLLSGARDAPAYLALRRPAAAAPIASAAAAVWR